MGIIQLSPRTTNSKTYQMTTLALRMFQTISENTTDTGSGSSKSKIYLIYVEINENGPI